MKIILRDTLTHFFPKHSPIFDQLSKEEKQSLLSFEDSSVVGNHNGNNNKALILQKNRKQTLVTPQLGSRRSSSSMATKQKQKAISLLHRNKSKEDQEVLANKSIGEQKEGQSSEIMNEKMTKQVRSFIEEHRFYSKSTNIDHLLGMLNRILIHCPPSTLPTTKPRSLPSKPVSPFPLIQQNLYKLSLYLNKQTNKQIFSVYEHILLANPKTGISYETLSKKLKTDIINVSHYCCKLKKMRFIDWEHKKEGVVVFPKAKKQGKMGENFKTGHDSSTKKDIFPLTTISFTSQSSQKPFDYVKSFLYNELTLNQNILLNVSSCTSMLQGGLTNEEIKFKIMKHAQNKMVRRTVEGMKHIQKNAERQGKVFEFKYKNDTVKMTKEMDKKRVQSSCLMQLTPKCRQYMNTHYSHLTPTPFPYPLQNEQLLQHIVNTKLTDYYSSIGIKQSKRQCTPLKLNRYILVLNYLENQGPESELDLRRHIIDVEKEMESYQGIIHKRSVLGILEGLKKIGVIEEVEGWFYPKWVKVERRVKKREEEEEEDDQQFYKERLDKEGDRWEERVKGSKRMKTDKSSRDNTQLSQGKNKKGSLSIPKEKIRMITKRQHLSQIFTELLNFTFQKALKRVLRKGLHRIMYVQRKRQTLPMFTPQPNIFHLLDSPIPSAPHPSSISTHSTTLQTFMSQISSFISTSGKKLQNFPQVQNEVVKYVRKNPTKNADSLRSKYGKSWRGKFQALERENVIRVSEDGYETVGGWEAGVLV